jgi:hypothetical protein
MSLKAAEMLLASAEKVDRFFLFWQWSFQKCQESDCRRRRISTAVLQWGQLNKTAV